MPGVPGLERKVFLSHTAELTSFPRDMSFVAAAERAVTRAGDRAIDMAHFGARDDKPSDFCVQQASECHVYVGLVGFRYGSPVPDSPEVSFTELEFNAATAAGRPRLVFLLDDDAEVPFRKFVDFAYGDRQDRFRARLRDSGIITAGFRTAADLETAVLDALVKLRESQRLAAGFEDNGRRRSPGRVWRADRGWSPTAMARWSQDRFFPPGCSAGSCGRRAGPSAGRWFSTARVGSARPRSPRRSAAVPRSSSGFPAGSCGSLSASRWRARSSRKRSTI